MKKIYKGLLLSTLLFSAIGTSQAAYFPKAAGNVYVMDNNPAGNNVIAFTRFANGRLSRLGSVSTGGLGAGDNAEADPLGSQESVILSENGKNLYLVNAGSNTISVFYLTRRGRPILIQEVSSEGTFPVSLTTDGDVLYVLNAGDNGSIAGYSISKSGKLSLMSDSIRSLETGQEGIPEGGLRNLAPGDIAFDTVERRLVIPFGRGTELGDGRILSFEVNDQGLPSDEFVETVATGRLPFSVDFTQNGIPLIAEALGAEGGEPTGGSLSSFQFSSAGADISPMDIIANGQAATCWVRAGSETDFAFTSNTNGGSISSYQVSRNGELTLLNAEAATDIGLPIDFDLTDDDAFLYVTTSSEGGVRGYRVNKATGDLISLGLFGGNLPIFENDGFAPQGLAVR